MVGCTLLNVFAVLHEAYKKCAVVGKYKSLKVIKRGVLVVYVDLYFLSLADPMAGLLAIFVNVGYGSLTSDFTKVYDKTIIVLCSCTHSTSLLDHVWRQWRGVVSGVR